MIEGELQATIVLPDVKTSDTLRTPIIDMSKEELITLCENMKKSLRSKEKQMDTINAHCDYIFDLYYELEAKYAEKSQDLYNTSYQLKLAQHYIEQIQEMHQTEDQQQTKSPEQRKGSTVSDSILLDQRPKTAPRRFSRSPQRTGIPVSARPSAYSLDTKHDALLPLPDILGPSHDQQDANANNSCSGSLLDTLAEPNQQKREVSTVDEENLEEKSAAIKEENKPVLKPRNGLKLSLDETSTGYYEPVPPAEMSHSARPHGRRKHRTTSDLLPKNKLPVLHRRSPPKTPDPLIQSLPVPLNRDPQMISDLDKQDSFFLNEPEPDQTSNNTDSPVTEEIAEKDRSDQNVNILYVPEDNFKENITTRSVGKSSLYDSLEVGSKARTSPIVNDGRQLAKLDENGESRDNNKSQDDNTNIEKAELKDKEDSQAHHGRSEVNGPGVDDETHFVSQEETTCQQNPSDYLRHTFTGVTLGSQQLPRDIAMLASPRPHKRQGAKRSTSQSQTIDGTCNLIDYLRQTMRSRSPSAEPDMGIVNVRKYQEITTSGDHDSKLQSDNILDVQTISKLSNSKGGLALGIAQDILEEVFLNVTAQNKLDHKTG